MGHRLRRITMDWDFKNKLKVLYYFWKATKYLNGLQDEKIVLKKSNSKGYHLFLWTRSKGNTLQIRKSLADDKHRLRLDQLHRNGRNTMFSHKIKKRKVL